CDGLYGNQFTRGEDDAGRHTDYTDYSADSKAPEKSTFYETFWNKQAHKLTTRPAQ
ncbi:hypothetical protein OS493_005374, partial [Desmophyllum pertusum]